MIWLRCYCSRKGDRLIIRRRFSLGKGESGAASKGRTESLPLYPMAERGKCVQKEGQNREKQHILMGLILRKFYRKRKILPAAGGVFQRNTAAGRFGSRGMGGKSSQCRGAESDFLVGREPLCQNRGSLLRIKFQSLGFVKGRRVFR